MATRKSTASTAATHGIPAVAYVRMSSDKQDASPDQQRDAIAKLAAKLGYKIVCEYSDLGISGDATDKRRGFQNMISAAAGGSFRAILAWDQSRFGRFDSIEAGYWVFPLVQAGVELVTVAEGRIGWTDFSGRLMFAIQAEAKHTFLRDMSRNVIRGQSEAARRGEWLGVPPLGYVKIDRRLAIDEATAATVRRIFALYVSGLSLRGIAERFNHEGIRTASGKPWQFNAIGVILRNHAYAGTYRWGFESESKYDAATEPIEILDNHPAIVDAATFANAQRLLSDRKAKSAPIRNGGPFALTGLMKCARCGASMTGRLASGEAVYTCSTYQRRGRVCVANRVRQSDVLDAVLGTIERQFLDPQSLDKLKAELRQQAERQTDPKLADRLRKQVATVEAKLAKATRRLIECETDMLRTVEASIRELRTERERLADELKAAATPRKRLQAAADDRIRLAVDAVSRLRQTLKSEPLKLRELLREAVERIDVKAEQYLDGKRRLWRLTGGTIHLRGGFVSNLFTAS